VVTGGQINGSKSNNTVYNAIAAGIVKKIFVDDSLTILDDQEIKKL